MNLDRRTLGTSALLSALVGAGLLLVFSRIMTSTPFAEATGRPAPSDRANPGRGRLSARAAAIVRNLLTPAGEVNERAVSALQALGPEIVPFLLDRLTGEDTNRQQAYLRVLAGFGDPEVTSRLLELIEAGPTERMARAIGAAVRAGGDADVCARLAESTRNSNPTVRLGAAAALRSCPGGASGAVLLRLVKSDPEPGVRVQALASLAECPRAFLEEGIEEALSDESATVRREAAGIAAESRLAAFRSRLASMSRNDPSESVRHAASAAARALRAADGPRDGRTESAAPE